MPTSTRSRPQDWLLPVVVFGVCLLPVTTHRGPGPAGYLWCAVLLSLGAGVIAGRLEDRGLRQKQWSYPVLLPFLALLLWAAATLLWSTAYQRVLALLPLVLAGLAAVLPALAITAARGEQVARLMTRTAGAAVMATAINALVYGPPEGRRLSVPLGSASSLHLPLTLCLAVIVAAAVSAGGLGRWGLAALAVVCLVLVQSADSRAGTVGLVVLLWLVAGRILWGRRQRFAIGALAAGVGTAALIGYLMLSRPHISLTDSTRWNNVARGLTAWTDSGWAIVPGRGTSSVWPWFAAEMSRGGFFARSPWGELLWHPHSTLLGVLVETGLVGAVLLLVTLGVVLVACVRALRERDPMMWLPAASLLATTPGMLVETYLVRGFPAAVIWWTVALYIVRGVVRTRPGSG